jgi:hypothetical protein
MAGGGVKGDRNWTKFFLPRIVSARMDYVEVIAVSASQFSAAFYAAA